MYREDPDLTGRVSPSGPWYRLRLGGAGTSALEQQTLLEAMRDLLRVHAIQASSWRAAGLRVAEVRVLVYSHREADVVAWDLNAAAVDLYRAAGGVHEPRARVEEPPAGEARALVLDGVDYHFL